MRNLFKGPDDSESDLTKEGRTKDEHCQVCWKQLSIRKGLSGGLKVGQGVKDEY